MADTSREQMQQDIKGALEFLRIHVNSLNKLVETLNRTMQSDVSFVAIEDAVSVLEEVPECKEVVSNVAKCLKARVRTRVKDL